MIRPHPPAVQAQWDADAIKAKAERLTEYAADLAERADNGQTGLYDDARQVARLAQQAREEARQAQQQADAMRDGISSHRRSTP